MLDEVYASHISALLLLLLDSTHCAQGFIAGLSWIHTSGDVFLDQMLNVIAKLLVQFLFDLVALKKRAQS